MANALSLSDLTRLVNAELAAAGIAQRVEKASVVKVTSDDLVKGWGLGLGRREEMKKIRENKRRVKEKINEERERE